MENSLFVGGNEGINSKDVDPLSTCASANACPSTQDADAAGSAASAYTSTDGMEVMEPNHPDAYQSQTDVDDARLADPQSNESENSQSTRPQLNKKQKVTLPKLQLTITNTGPDFWSCNRQIRTKVCLTCPFFCLIKISFA